MSRRMFIVHKGTVCVAPAECPWSHYEWLIGFVPGELVEEMHEKSPRGYVLGNRLMIYIGDDFSRWVAGKDVRIALNVFDAMFPGQITEIGVGAKPGKEQPWEPKLLMTRETFSKWTS